MSFWKGSFITFNMPGTEMDGIKTWDDQEGGDVVEEFEEDGVEYVLVEFHHSPGKRYMYRA